jgi:hypothetical protein
MVETENVSRPVEQNKRDRKPGRLTRISVMAEPRAIAFLRCMGLPVEFSG